MPGYVEIDQDGFVQVRAVYNNVRSLHESNF